MFRVVYNNRNVEIAECHRPWLIVACFGCLMLLICGGLGCSASPKAKADTAKLGTDRRCESMIGRLPSGEQASSVIRSSDTDVEEALTQFSPQVVELGQILDVLPLLNQIAALDQPDSLVEFLDLRQQLTDEVLLALFETASTVAELVCETDRTNQSADRMDALDAARVKGLTIASLLVGGLAAVASGGLGLAGAANAASNAADVAGGAFSTLFGGYALTNHAQQEFLHERNLLAEIWNDPKDPSLFSPSTWRFLHIRHKERDVTQRDELIHSWRQEGRLGESGSDEESKRIALIFGQGGLYTAPDLRARSAMLETLAATVRLIHDELELFFREISKRFGRRRYS